MNQKVVSNPISKNKTGTYPNAQQSKENEQWQSHSSDNEQYSTIHKSVDES